MQKSRGKRIGIASSHIGLSKVAAVVAAHLLKAHSGNEIRWFLDPETPSWEDGQLHKAAQSVLGELYGRVTVVDPYLKSPYFFSEQMKKLDILLTTMSPTDAENIEVRSLVDAPIGVPAYLYSEVPCGHSSPGFHMPIRGTVAFNHAERVFVAQRTPDLMEDKRVVEVGPQLSWVRALGMDGLYETGVKTKQRFMFSHRPFVWFYGAPNWGTITILRDLVHSLSAIAAQGAVAPALIVTRHARDKGIDGIDQHYWNLMELAATRGLRVVEVSSDHAGRLSRFAYDFEVSYRDLQCACKIGGVLVTGHGTDGILAPWLRVPSILCCGSKEYDPDLLKDKKVRKLPLPSGMPPQVGSFSELDAALRRFFDPISRQQYIAACEDADEYRLPVQTPEEIIGNYLLD